MSQGSRTLAFRSGFYVPNPLSDHELGHVGNDVPRDMLDAITRQLEPTLGDIGHIRVHTGPMATAAAEAMKARAFAIADLEGAWDVLEIWAA